MKQETFIKGGLRKIVRKPAKKSTPKKVLRAKNLVNKTSRRGMLQPIIRQGKDGLWYASIKSASNGKQIWNTGDGYKMVRGALKAINCLASPKMLPTEIIR